MHNMYTPETESYDYNFQYHSMFLISEIDPNRYQKDTTADHQVLAYTIVTFMKDIRYFVFMIIQLFFFIGVSITLILFKSYAKSCGIPETTANMMLSILGIGSTVGRWVSRQMHFSTAFYLNWIKIAMLSKGTQLTYVETSCYC